MTMVNNYSNYANSFYSNDIKVLKKRKKQAKIFAAASIATGAVSGTAALLSKKPSVILKWVVPVLGMILGANALNYSKQTEKKINRLEVQG